MPRVLVVGASSGVGQATVVALARAGSPVTAMARRGDRLRALGEQVRADPSSHPIAVFTGDARREDDCRVGVHTAISAMGDLDAIVYATGVSDMAAIVNTSVGEWQRIMETNVIGAARVFAHPQPNLSANPGQMVFLSSASVVRPKPGLVPYAASKAALHKLVEGLRSEAPEVAFTMITIGPTSGTEFAEAFDPQVARGFMDAWRAGGFLAPGQMTSEDVAERIVQCLVAPMRTEDMFLLPHPPVSARPGEELAT